MKRRRKRKCLHCGELYGPDLRTRDRQKHCSQPECRRASKAWRQRRWLSKPENQDYFRGPDQVARVQRWREAHPGYGPNKRPVSEKPLQDDCPPQPTGAEGFNAELNLHALQDDCLMQPAVVLGLISNLTGSTLQDDIARTIRHLHARGQIILGNGPGMEPKGTEHDEQTNLMCAAEAEGPRTVQLGRSPPGT
jgi:hypothetical protein